VNYSWLTSNHHRHMWSRIVPHSVRGILMVPACQRGRDHQHPAIHFIHHTERKITSFSARRSCQSWPVDKKTIQKKSHEAMTCHDAFWMVFEWTIPSKNTMTKIPWNYQKKPPKKSPAALLWKSLSPERRWESQGPQCHFKVGHQWISWEHTGK